MNSNSVHRCKPLINTQKERSHGIEIRNNILFLISGDDTYISCICKIEYCPFCGKQLDIEAKENEPNSKGNSQSRSEDRPDLMEEVD